MSAPLLGPSGTRNLTVRCGQDWAEGWDGDGVAHDMKATRTMNALICARVFIRCMAFTPAACGFLHAEVSSLTNIPHPTSAG
jgi:hypothetical protein